MEGRVPGNASIIDDNIDLAELRLNLLDARRDSVIVRHIKLKTANTGRGLTGFGSSVIAAIIRRDRVASGL